MTYIVTINNPYYPSIEYFEEKSKAETYMKTLLNDRHADKGNYGSKVTIAEVINTVEITTEY